MHCITGFVLQASGRGRRKPAKGIACARWFHALAMKTFIVGIIPPPDRGERASSPQGSEVVSG